MTDPKPWRTASIAGLGALEIRERLSLGETNASDVTAAHLALIEAREKEISAFAFHDPEVVVGQATAARRRSESGRAAGELNGIPVGIKDIIDTADMPTENGTPIDAGRQPRKDATIVSRLRQSGAVIMGKTATTELAYLDPGPTRNPNDRNRTPGGSSSGSAAAVAAGFVPLAIGSQTNGSVIRPASYCGVVGFKPTHGLIPRTGSLMLSRPLDTIGVFGRSVEDVALLVDAIAGYDGHDPDTGLRAAPRLLETSSSQPPVPPDLAFVESPAWEHAAPETQSGFRELADLLGDRCATLDLAKSFSELFSLHRTLMTAGMARHLEHYLETGREKLSAPILEALEEGRRAPAIDYLQAQEKREGYYAALDEVFNRFDAIITPAAAGEAPEGLQSTGDPEFCTIWSYCGVPAISLPLLEGPNGLPVGVQMIGRRGEDARLLRTARWLVNFVAEQPGGEE